jgi:hypothetical protein
VRMAAARRRRPLGRGHRVTGLGATGWRAPWRRRYWFRRGPQGHRQVEGAVRTMPAGSRSGERLVNRQKLTERSRVRGTGGEGCGRVSLGNQRLKPRRRIA